MPESHARGPDALPRHRLSAVDALLPESTSSQVPDSGGPRSLRRLVEGFGGLIASGLLTRDEAHDLLADVLEAVKRHREGGDRA